ncbi:MAG: hypothetical protein ABI478_13025 [Propionivibrio sp.]
MSEAIAALARLERFLALTRAINTAVEDQEWDETARLDAERAAQLGRLPIDLAARVGADEAARARAIIEKCLQLDARTRVRAEERQKSIRVLLREP